ncbi:uncharacterized protein V2V93DRAFT_359724 [Kockiozyma suomiensis]|uniref:uncharacterized protein n=1 Tax=Kockiozyma suomiensis TaxID=1337062 RepID=UPI0033436877
MSSSRFNGTSLHQRDARTQLFDGFDSSSSSRPNSPGFRTATPNARGQYSDSVMSGLESQNENELEGLTARVRLLKDITVKIGEEVRDSSKFMGSLEDGFDNTKLRLKGTYKRMMRMAERSGVGWRAWVAFFLFVFLIFVWVWKF